MNAYVDKIHEIIEKVDPITICRFVQLNINNVSYNGRYYFWGWDFTFSMLFKNISKVQDVTGDFGDDSKAFFFGAPVIT